jgi:pimeloyl-ACP methyl ester carboxylesterase
MIHGAGGRAFVWQQQLYELNRGCNTLALDLPGHGETPGPLMDRLELYADWLRKALAELAPGPVFLMGHSMGGAIVLHTALRGHPDLRALIVAGAGARLRVADPLLQGLLCDFESTVERILRFAYARQADPLLLSEGAALLKSAGARTLQADFLACDRFDLRAEVGRIDLPCLILCGDEDQMTPPKLGRSLHEALPGSELQILPGSGHMAMIESPAAFNARVREFLERRADEKNR